MRFGGFWLDYWRCLLLAIRGMGRDNISIMASGMVYSTLIAVIPCLTFLTAFLSVFGVLQPFMNLIAMLFEDTFGANTGHELVNYIQQFSSNAMSLGVIGLISFIITGIFLVNKIYTAVNQIFRTRATSGTVRRFTAILTFLIMGAFMIVALFALQSIVSNTIMIIAIGDRKAGNFFVSIGGMAIIWVSLFLLYKAVPNTKVRSTSASIGASTALVSLLIATGIFRSITQTMVSYSVIYGSMASIFIALLYLYICWFIILFSAELAYVHQFRPDKTIIMGSSQAPARQISEAVNMLLIIADKYRKGEGATGQRELSRRLAVPVLRLSSYLNDLEDAAIVMAVNPQRTMFVPRRPLDQIKLRDVLTVLYGGLPESDEIETIGEAVASDFLNSGLANADNLTIENLLERI